ncbi:hypothetical protein PUN28_019994 [Cardiocondyla obscurior]
MDGERNMEFEAHGTPIQNFYTGQSIFITGGTGFLGKILIEKLLRTCPNISMIYLLIRSKKEKSPECRLDEIFEKPLFDRIKREVPNFHKKITPIVGDLDARDFGLSENDKNILITQTSIIFHVAANVRFFEHINIAITENVTATHTILKLAKRMPNLKSFIHVSTAFANCHVKHIEERFYSYPIKHKDLMTLIRNLPENQVEKKISTITSQWANTYTFTKAIAEGLLRDESGDLPIAIFRPSIVLSTANEPVAGWIDNVYGPIGITVAGVLGIARFHHCNGNVKANIVPVDLTVNALIVSAWDTFNQNRKGKHMLIYNYVSPVDGPTWNEYAQAILDINKIYPVHKAIYLPLNISFKSKALYTICFWLGCFIPALFIDVATMCMNHTPRLWKMCIKINKFSQILEPFSNNEWTFSTDNVCAMWERITKEDQQLFNFDMNGFDWTKYFINLYQGIRLYVLDENDSTLEISRKKYKR